MTDGIALLATVAVLSLTGCTSATQQGATTYRDEMVKISDDRAIHLTCDGLDQSGPTVVLVAGSQSAGDTWTLVPKPGRHPSQTGHELTLADVEPSPDSVMPRVARFAPVCAYDRPGTFQHDGTLAPTTMVQQPTTAQQGASDLHALLTAAGVPGPYVLVGHSWGGLIATVFASTYPAQTAGLVLVDPANAYLQRDLPTSAWTSFLAVADAQVDGTRKEAPAYVASLAGMAGTTVPHVPTVVLTSDRPFNSGAGDNTFPMWQQAAAELSAALNARHITKTDSGHLIPTENPALVADAIKDVHARST